MKALPTPLLAFSTFLRFFFIPLRDDTRPHVSKFISVTVKRVSFQLIACRHTEGFSCAIFCEIKAQFLFQIH